MCTSRVSGDDVGPRGNFRIGALSQNLAADQFPWLPVRWLLRDSYESVKYAPAIATPTLLLEAERDELIPSASTRRLLAAFKPGIASLKVIPGAGHNDISKAPVYMATLQGKP